MKCKDLLGVLSVTQRVIVINGHKEIARGDVSQVALDLPNSLLDKNIKVIRAHSKSVIVITLEG